MTVRIIAGEFKGRRLQAPKGQTTRPTTDRVRESLMSAIASARGGFAGAVVLDAFSGSGALGLEALSRGAAFSWFCEQDGVALRALSANFETLGLGASGAGARVRLQRGDVLARPPVRARPPFDLVMLDPPYALPAPRVLGLVTALADGGALAKDALITYEHDRATDDDVDVAAATRGLLLASRRKYGDTVIDLFRVGGKA